MKEEKSFKSRIFPTITTISKKWPEKIKEVGKLKLKKVCFFPTCLDKKERKKAYNLLKKTSVKEIPIVHIKGEMKTAELNYLVENYNTRAFTLHTQREYPLLYDYSKYRDRLFIENVFHFFDEKELDCFGGMCLDLSHLENDRILHKEKFENIKQMLKKHKIGCNHISAIKKMAHKDKFEENTLRYDSHHFEDLSEFDYLKKYPKNYFSNLIAIELENSIKDQLLVKDYIANILYESC
jgi:hypothetical protein